jgi:hypothetical protein
MKTLVKLAAAIAFLLLTALAFEVHELSHHFFGWAVCGAPGTISFTQFEVARGCGVSESRLTELFGPLMGMALAYGGAYWVRRRASLFGFGLIFASYFHLRFLPSLLGGGSDELDLARRSGFLHGSRFGVAAVLFVLALPPLVIGGLRSCLCDASPHPGYLRQGGRIFHGGESCSSWPCVRQASEHSGDRVAGKPRRGHFFFPVCQAPPRRARYRPS